MHRRISDLAGDVVFYWRNLTLSNQKQKTSRRMIMKRMATILMMGMLLIAPAVHAENQQPAAAQGAIRNEQVMGRLTTMGQYLRGLKTFGIHADLTNDEVMENGQKLQFVGTADYLVKTPDRLRLEVKDDSQHRIYTYDNKFLTQYSPRLGYYATMETTGPIGKILIGIKEKFDLEMPLADLFLWGTDKDGSEDIKEADFVGVEQINGHDSEHFAFRQEGVDWQIWIQPGDQPLPDKLVITSTEDLAQPNYVVNLKWNLTPESQESDFTFTPPQGATKIEIVRVDQSKKNN